jgi:hypothetical protein
MNVPKLAPQVVDNAVKAVRHLRSLGCTDIEFSPEDAGRSDPKFLYRILAAVIEAGATTLNIPDTTGEACVPCSKATLQSAHYLPRGARSHQVILIADLRLIMRIFCTGLQHLTQGCACPDTKPVGMLTWLHP